MLWSKANMFCKLPVWIVLLASLYIFSGCGKPGGSDNNLTNSVVTIQSINDNKPLQSDVLTDGFATDDTVTVSLSSDFRATEDDDTAPNGASISDTITFTSYLVSHMRSDGGTNPTSFTGGMNLVIAPDSDAEVDLVVVRAFDKNRSPLKDLRDDGEIFTTTTLTLYGSDGNGNDIAVSGSLSISFSNFLDE
jgi:hypothetical protein